MGGAASAIFYDGVAAKPRPVTLRFGEDALEILERESIVTTFAEEVMARL